MRIEEYPDAQGSPLSRYWQRLLSSEYPDARESPLSVARKWLPWSIGLIFALTLGWTALIALDRGFEREARGHTRNRGCGRKQDRARSPTDRYLLYNGYKRQRYTGRAMHWLQHDIWETSSSSLSSRSTGRRAETKAGTKAGTKSGANGRDGTPAASKQSRAASLSTSRRPRHSKPTAMR